MAEPGEGAGELLLHLVTAVGAGHVDDQPEFSSRVVHILPLELFQLGLRKGKFKTGRGDKLPDSENQKLL